eukprot:969716-Pelagomonas_calceolata.AAC.12
MSVADQQEQAAKGTAPLSGSAGSALEMRTPTAPSKVQPPVRTPLLNELHVDFQELVAQKDDNLDADFSCAQQTAAGHGFPWLKG